MFVNITEIEETVFHSLHNLTNLPQSIRVLLPGLPAVRTSRDFPAWIVVDVVG